MTIPMFQSFFLFGLENLMYFFEPDYSPLRKLVYFAAHRFCLETI